MKQQMSKYQAEQTLGLKGSYTFKDLKTAHRKMALSCHPDQGGKDEDMVKVNQAHDVLKKQFVNNKDATIPCATKDTATTTASRPSTNTSTSSTSSAPKSATNTSYARSNTNTANTSNKTAGSAYNASGASAAGASAAGGAAAGANTTASTGQKIPVDDFRKVWDEVFGFNSQQAYTPKATPNQYSTPRQTYQTPSASTPSSSTPNGTAANSDEYAKFVDFMSDFISGANKTSNTQSSSASTPNTSTYSKSDRVETGGEWGAPSWVGGVASKDIPGWWKFWDAVVRKWWWRFFFLMLGQAGFWGLAVWWVTTNMRSDNYLWTLLFATLFFLPLLNVIFGLVTNPIRGIIRASIDDGLKTHLDKKTKKKAKKATKAKKK